MLKKIINNRNVAKYLSITKEINKEYEKIKLDPSLILSDELLKLRTNFSMTNKNKTIKAMALAKQAVHLILGMTYYDVQLMGALALVDGAMAEMKTGEGKTLTCSAAVIANYALGYSTHVATANEYLAQRDQITLEPIYSFIGIRSGANSSQLTKLQKAHIYSNDVVYSTAQEFGFDFLRDNLIYNTNEKIQPKYFNHLKCIIDEADFVLIDEARTPLIISGEAPVKEDIIYHKIKNIVSQFIKIPHNPNSSISYLEEDNHGDFWLDEKQKNIFFSNKGYIKLENFCKKENLLLPIKNKANNINNFDLYDESNAWIINEALNALKAQYLFKKDKEYIIHEGKIVIIDPNTGRLSNGRSWSNGLHQAIEAKENLKINPENMTLGSISIQNYFRNYKQISGMSGTILQSSEEFEEIYHCKTIQIPTNKPVLRKEHQDRIYITTQVKHHFMIQDILARHKNGQPVLIGTVSVEESEIISQLLDQNNIKHYVLNAKNNALEAQIIAQAGEPFRVTVATSMAGRGTDIILGGNKETINEILYKQIEQLNERIQFAEEITSNLDIEENILIDLSYEKQELSLNIFNNQEKINLLYSQDYFIEQVTNNAIYIWKYLYNLKTNIKEQINILESNWQQWRQQVINLGGLCVIGSSRNESRRIDDQLRGRAGRQGDPGENIFYMSLEDPWVNVFGKNAIFSQLIKTLPQNESISSSTITKVFSKAQKNIESFHFDIRKNTYQYDSVTDEGRRKFLGLRNDLLFNPNMVKEILNKQLHEDLYLLTNSDFIEYIQEKNMSDVTLTIKDILNYPLNTIYQLINEYMESEEYSLNLKFKPVYSDLLEDKINKLIATQDEELWKALNLSILETLDHHWSHHLDFIEEAQKNVAFSSIAQKNPIYEYKKICFQSFSYILTTLREKMVQDFINRIYIHS